MLFLIVMKLYNIKTENILYIMESKSCVLVGCTKNSAGYIEEHIMKLYKLKEIFQTFPYRFI